MWLELAEEYRGLIGNRDWDSAFLREHGLIPNVVEMVGDCEDSVLLDAGTGSGWLFEHVKPAEAYACDIVEPKTVPDWVKFETQNVEALSYRDDTFDIIVASLLLMFCENLGEVCSSLFRVAKSQGGRLIVSLTHPYFYRTGTAISEDEYLIERHLSRPFQTRVNIAGQVGPFIYYYRPFPDYVNALIEAGWQVTRLRDWFIDMAKYKKLAESGINSKIKRSGQVPLYTFIECRKP